MNVGFASPQEVDQLWPLFSQRMQKACDRCGGDLSSGMLWQMCRSGSAYMMVAHDTEKAWMASVWRFEDWPTGTVMRCLALAGENPRLWAKDAKEFAVKARDAGGAKRFIFEGRNWRPFFPEARELRRVYEV